MPTFYNVPNKIDWGSFRKIVKILVAFNLVKFLLPTNLYCFLLRNHQRIGYNNFSFSLWIQECRIIKLFALFARLFLCELCSLFALFLSNKIHFCSFFRMTAILKICVGRISWKSHMLKSVKQDVIANTWLEKKKSAFILVLLFCINLISIFMAASSKSSLPCCKNF